MPSPAANSLTEAHRVEQRQISLDVVRGVLLTWGLTDPADIDKAWPVISAILARIIAAGHARSAALAVSYLRSHASLEGVVLRDFVIPQPLPAAQVEAVLRITGPVTLKRSTGNGVPLEQGTARAATQLSGAATRLAMQGGRTAITDTARRSSQIVGYRRVTVGSSCYFCALMSSRGAVYKSAATALQSATGRRRGTQDPGESFHDHCDCTVEPLYVEETEPQSVLDLQRRYRDALDAYPGKTAIAAWRTAYEAA